MIEAFKIMATLLHLIIKLGELSATKLNEPLVEIVIIIVRREEGVCTVFRVFPVVLAAGGTLLRFLEILVNNFFELDHLVGVIGERIRGRKVE
jgi:hypothetical protein